jgi:hypothetical protein
MPNIKTVQQSFEISKQGITQLYYGMNLLKALSLKIITESDDTEKIGKIEDFVEADGDWKNIVAGLKDIFEKLQLKGAGVWNSAESSPEPAPELLNSFDFKAGYYSAYRVTSQVSLGNVSLAAFYDEETPFETKDVNLQIEAVNNLIDQLDAVVGIYGDLGCAINF